MVRYKKRENKKGSCYQATIRIHGYNTICKTFKLKSDAQAWAEPIELAMKNGTYKQDLTNSIVQNNSNINTMADLIDFYDKEVAQYKYSHYEKYPAIYSWWKSKIGDIKVINLSSSILSSCKNILKDEKIKKGHTETRRSANTINKYLMCLSAILTYAVKDLEIIDVNPMSKVSLMKKPNGRTRFLSDEEIEIVKKNCKKHSDMLYLFFLLALKTGGRFNEIRHLQLKDIDYKNCRVYFLDTKNKTHRGVHVDSGTLNLIAAYVTQNNIESGYIFRSTKNGIELADIKGILEKAIKDSKIEDFHIHDIRHTTASILARNGASLLEIAEILGQKSLSVARRYSHLTKKHTEELMSSIMDKY